MDFKPKKNSSNGQNSNLHPNDRPSNGKFDFTWDNDSNEEGLNILNNSNTNSPETIYQNNLSENYSEEDFDPSEYNKEDFPEEKPKSFFGKVKLFIVKRQKFFRFAFFSLLFLGIIGGVLASIYTIATYNNLGDVVTQATEISEGSIVYDRNQKELFRFQGEITREVVGIDQIPEEMKAAIIALEDENYYRNNAGIPWTNLVGATGKCLLSRGNNCRGGSGLSQQLIKNVTGDNEKSVDRKYREILTAVKFNQDIGESDEQKQDKVLELYLNWVPFGRNNYGVQSASRSYFGHEINSDKLNPAKACYLASMVQRPSTFALAIENEIKNRQNRQAGEPEIENPNWQVLEARKNACIQKLYELDLANRGTTKVIASQQEAKALQDEIIEFIPRNLESTISYGHLRQYIQAEMAEKLDIKETDLLAGGYKIYTTFDKDIQDNSQKIIEEGFLNNVQGAGGNNVASLILDTSTAEVIAMIGSRDFNNEEIDGQVNVVFSPRQPGSSYKPYVYASAFEKGFNPSTVLLDLSTDFGQYRPANFSKTTSGATTIRKSLQDSLNIPAVKAAYLSQSQSGTPNAGEATNNFLDFAERSGVVHSFRDKGTCTLSAALGGCEVTMFSHVNGYNTLFNNGLKSTPRPFLKVLDKNGFDVYANAVQISNPYPQQQAVDPEIANQISNVLSDYDSRSPSVWGNSRFNLQLEGWTGENQVAAKTGTTNDVKDVWTVGGTPYYTLAVWAGNTKGQPMDSRVSSSSIVAPIWQDLMKSLHNNITPKGFSKTGLQNVRVDSLTGLLSENGNRTELMTEAQIRELAVANENLARENYNPEEGNIFTNRTPIVSRKVVVSKIDGGLVESELNQENSNSSIDSNQPNNQQLPSKSLVEELICQQIVSEFPTFSNWYSPAQSYQQTLAESNAEIKFCPTEKSTAIDEDLEPIITSNILPNNEIPENIIIEAETNQQLEENQIVEIVLYVNDQEVFRLENSNILSVTFSELIEDNPNLVGIAEIKITAKDDFGLVAEQLISKVKLVSEAEEDLRSNSSSSSSSSASTSSSSSQSSSRRFEDREKINQSSSSSSSS